MPFVILQLDVFSCTLEFGRRVDLGRRTCRKVSSLTCSSVIRPAEVCGAVGAAVAAAVCNLFVRAVEGELCRSKLSPLAA